MSRLSFQVETLLLEQKATNASLNLQNNIRASLRFSDMESRRDQVREAYGRDIQLDDRSKRRRARFCKGLPTVA